MVYRMGKKTSVYLADDLSEAVEASGLSLADLIRIGLASKPRLIEGPDVEISGRTWTTWWFCEVPDKAAKFRVLRDEWHTGPDGRPVRKIYEIQVTDQATITVTEAP